MSGLGSSPKQERQATPRRLACRGCGHEKVLTAAWMNELREQIPALSKEGDLLVGLLPRFRCSECGGKDLQVIQDTETAR